MAYLYLVEELKFTSELTGTDNSQQHSRAERPQKDLLQMMRRMLHSANLGPKYWTYALSQAVYIKNRIPHKSLNMTVDHVYVLNDQFKGPQNWTLILIMELSFHTV